MTIRVYVGKDRVPKGYHLQLRVSHTDQPTNGSEIIGNAIVAIFDERLSTAKIVAEQGSPSSELSLADTDTTRKLLYSLFLPYLVGNEYITDSVELEAVKQFDELFNTDKTDIATVIADRIIDALSRLNLMTVSPDEAKGQIGDVGIFDDFLQ